jgi:hypothetical protein
MEHRTQLLGGTIEWIRRKEKGTVITIKIPVNNKTLLIVNHEPHTDIKLFKH